MAWDIRQITKTFDVTDDEGNTATVTIRKLSEGDRQDIYDAINVGGSGVLSGTLRRLSMERAVTAWTLPVPLSPEALRNLPYGAADTIYDEVCEWSRWESADPPTEAS